MASPSYHNRSLRAEEAGGPAWEALSPSERLVLLRAAQRVAPVLDRVPALLAAIEARARDGR